jgi:hypothetical protein
MIMLFDGTEAEVIEELRLLLLKLPDETLALSFEKTGYLYKEGSWVDLKDSETKGKVE